MIDKRVAVVTGASRGIGRAIALRLASDGRHVVLVSRNQGPLGEVRAEIEQAGGTASVQAADVGDGSAWASAIESIADEFGRLDILVNNAGITRDNLVLRMSDDEWDEVVRVNLTSAFVATRAAARPMMRGKFGRIVNIASTSGVVGNAGQANYAASKAGLHGFTKSVARELAPRGVRCNAVAPGYIRTDMTSGLDQSVVEELQAHIPMERLGEPGEVASVIRFLAGPGARYITGQVITVDGGMVM